MLDSARNISEKKFAEICIKRNYEISHADRKQDIEEHWDWKVINPNKGGKITLVDVKGARKKSRKDDGVDFEITWLEVKNVRGNKGSLLGNADLIAFEQEKYFLLVKREDLRAWLKKKITNKKIVTDPRKALYRFYRRENRQDIISLVSIKDIERDLKCWKFF
jgi:hypothetical protein